ncbi:MAG: endonuclease MutS2, partial [Planctomycetota bacterium]
MDPQTLEKVEFGAVRHILTRFCRCGLGAGMAEHIGPSRNAEVIGRWLAQTTQMVEAVRDVGLPPTGGVADIAEALSRAHPGGGPSGADFAAISATLKAVGEVKAYLLALPESLAALTEMAEHIDDFGELISRIDAIVAADGRVHDTASDRLRRVRREITETSGRVGEVIRGYLRQPEGRKLRHGTNVTLHEDRYVLPVRTENRGRLPGVVHRTSGSGATVFVEPNACVELNNHLADLHDDERKEITRLLIELSVHVAAEAHSIDASVRGAVQVDLVSAKAQYAYQFDMVPPELSAEGPVELAQARHPLLIEQAARDADWSQPVVPIDIRLGSDFDILVITGSNTGGKTVTLKTLALLVVMAQSGMHIPTQRGCKLPIFQDVLIDVGDEQSLEQSLSTFGGHIVRIKKILHKAGPHSLVLLDELGAGTDPDEGGAIGQAILDELQHAKCLAMITTHLSVLKAYAFTHDRVDNASVEFDTKTLRPTYRLHVGTAGESHAITVADRLGLGDRVVRSARSHLSQRGQRFNKAIRATGTARRAAETARAEARQAELSAQDQADAYETKLKQVDQLRNDFEAWLAHLPNLHEGDEIFVPSLKATARLVRLELHKQLAVVSTGAMQMEVPLKELVPDLGQSGIRKQIEGLQEQLREQAQQTRQAADRAQ